MIPRPRQLLLQVLVACLASACARSPAPGDAQAIAGFNFTGRGFGIDQQLASTSVSRNADGRFVIAWTESDTVQHTDANAEVFEYAYLRLYSAQGEPLTGKIRVEDTGGQPYSVDVAIADDGAVLVTWAVRGDAGHVNDFNPIYARSYSAQGQPLGGVTYLAQVQDFNVAMPVAAARPGGGFLVAWQNYTENQNLEYLGDRLILRHDSAVSARFLARDATPQGPVKTLVQLPATLAGGPPETPALAFAPDGSFAVVWQTATMINNILNLQRFTREGDAIGAAQRVPPDRVTLSQSASIAMDAQGGFVVAWYGGAPGLGISTGPEEPHNWFRRYSPDARPLDPGTPIPAGDNRPARAGLDVCSGADGRYVITWFDAVFVPDDSAFPHYEPKKFGQFYSATGEPAGNVFAIERDPESFQDDVSITRNTACDASGGFVSIWGNRREEPTPIGSYYLYEGWARLFSAPDTP